MSKENAERFLGELGENESLQSELVYLAKKEAFYFTREEFSEALAELVATKLSDKELDKVSGGAFPTPVNCQITDSVT